MSNENRNDLQVTITQALEEIKAEKGDRFDLSKVNLADMERRTGVSRKKLRKLKADGFKFLPHGNTGRKKETTVLTGFTGVIDDLLRKNVTNAETIKERIEEVGYTGGITQVRVYIQEHQDLIPPKRQIVAPQGNRGRRYSTDPGKSYQMDWGFVDVETDVGKSYQAACFAMICHHCGERYVEFFPNAKQENLFIGMIHAFDRMGVPEQVLTDNMKSVVTGRNSEGHPLWNKEYEQFMDTIGFDTKLCKPRHPFTKGAVERLVRFIKGNFMAGRVFTTITDLNYQALRWCDTQNGRYHRCVDCVPHEEHLRKCMETAREMERTDALRYYLCPMRVISFDGFVSYEGRRFGVPYWYTKKLCRVERRDFTLTIYADDLSRKLVTHDVTWSRKDRFCEDQYAQEQPEEFPTAPVSISMSQIASDKKAGTFDRFNFGKEVGWDE